MNALKRKIKDFVLYLLKEDKVYFPKKQKDLKTVCFISKSPIGNGKYVEYTFTCTGWGNGEGFDISINTYNQHSNKDKTTNISLCDVEIEGIVACLNEFNMFDNE